MNAYTRYDCLRASKLTGYCLTDESESKISGLATEAEWKTWIPGTRRYFDVVFSAFGISRFDLLTRPPDFDALEELRPASYRKPLPLSPIAIACLML